MVVVITIPINGMASTRVGGDIIALPLVLVDYYNHLSVEYYVRSLLVSSCKYSSPVHTATEYQNYIL